MKKNSASSMWKRLAGGKNVLLLALLFAVFMMGIMPALEADIKVLSGGKGVMDLLFFYTPATAWEMLQSYGPEGKRLYLIAQWTADLVFPVTLFFFFTAALIWVGAESWYRLPLLVLVADWTENIIISILLWQHPVFHKETAIAGCFFTTLKWCLVLSCALIFVFYLIKKIKSGRPELKVQVNEG